MEHYFKPSCKKKFSGRQRKTLPVTLHRDLCRAQIAKDVDSRFIICTLTYTIDLHILTLIALDRKRWQALSKEVYEAAHAENLQ